MDQFILWYKLHNNRSYDFTLKPHLKSFYEKSGFKLFTKYKKQALDNISTEHGAYLRKKISIDVEALFGNIKQNMNFRRFILRSLPKVSIECRLPLSYWTTHICIYFEEYFAKQFV